MKTADQWLNQVGETVMFSAFAGGNPPGKEVESLVQQIQLDAWRQGMTDAAAIVDYARGDESDLRSIRDNIKIARDAKKSP